MIICFTCPIETVRKFEKRLPKPLTIESGVGNRIETANFSFMPSQHSTDKINVSAWVPRTLAARLKRLAKERKMKVTELLEWIFTQATHDIELTPEDYRKIAEDTERARQRQGAQGIARKATDARRGPKKISE